HNGRSYLRLEQPGGEAYVSYLSFSRFPDLMPFPDGEPWLHYADALPFPVEASLRMKLVPPAKASKDAPRRLAHARDMQAHLRVQRVEACTEDCPRIGIALTPTRGDQFSVFCESVPGGRLRLEACVQRQPLRTIAGGMPTATVALGDRKGSSGAGWIGPYIG